MIKFEFQKIFTQKHLVWLLCGLLAVYFLLFSNTVTLQRDNTPKKEDMDALFMDYFLNRSEVEEYYAYRETLRDEYREATRRMTAAEVEAYGKLTLPDRYMTTDAYDDDAAYNILNEQVRNVRSHETRLREIIRTAEKNMAEYESLGISVHSVTYRQQKKLADTYHDVLLKAPCLGFEYPCGWDMLFFSRVGDLFMILSVILFSTVLFAQEQSGGCIAVLRTTRYGRGRCVSAKLWTALLLSALTVVIYTALSAVMIGFSVGFSNGLNDIHIFEELQYAPLSLRMFDYLGILIVAKISGCLLLSFGVMLISLLSRSTAITWIASVALYASGYLVAGLSPDSLLYQLSPINVMHVRELMEQARYVPMGAPIPMSVAVAAIYLMLAAALILLLFRTYAVAAFTPQRSVRRLFVNTLTHRKKRVKRMRPHTLIYHEHAKSLFAARMLPLALILILLQGISAMQYYQPYTTQAERYYREYLSVVHGEVADSSRLFLQEEGARIASGLQNADQASALWRDGLIDEQTYHRAMDEYFYALQHTAAYEKIAGQLQYADAVAEQKNIHVQLINPRAWTQFFDDTLLYPILIWCVAVAAGIIPFEYQANGQNGGFASILRTTRRGRQHTFWAKLVTVVSLCGGGTLIYTAINVTAFCAVYGMPDIHAPLLSLPLFSDIHTAMTIGEYLPRFWMGCILSFTLVSLIIFCISEFTHHLLITLCVTTGVLFLPYAMSMSGISFARYLNLFSYLSVTPLYSISAEKYWLHSDSIFLLFLYVTLMLTTVGLTHTAYRSCCKGHPSIRLSLRACAGHRGSS